MKKNFIIILVILLSYSTVIAQSGKGSITGVVKDLKTGNAIQNVKIIISQTKQQTVTNEKGEFKFDGLKPGPYTLRFIHKDYNILKLPHQEIFANSTIFLPIELVPSSGEGEGTDDQFMIGGIEVTAKRDVLPTKLHHTTEISSSEIEHLQATSLGDVMQLIPGVGQMNPGLSKQNQLALRGVSSLGYGDATSTNTMFGTKIMIDGSTISNNANISNLTLGSVVATNAASGVDLRGIPADNIESVEVLQGVASAKYGDYTEGVVLVKTKAGYQPNRVKIKDNPDTKEINFNGGFDFSDLNMGLNYNVNFATSERNIRRDGDDYQRVSGQLKLTNTFFDDKSLSLTNGFYYTRIFDDYKDKVNPNGLSYYNHNYTIMYNNNIVYKFDNLTKLNFQATVNYTKQDRFKQDIPKGQEADNRYILGFTNPGTYLVDINIGSYVYQTYDKGNMWNITAELEYEKKGVRLGSLVHNLSFGINYQFDDNTGEGLTFDPTKPPGAKKRPLSYDLVPANDLLSVYAEDEIHGQLFKPFTLSLGLRYEMFSPQSIQWDGLLFKKDFVKSRSGSFLEPRITFRYNISSNTKLRLGYGLTAKSPSMDYLYPSPAYADIRDYFGDYRDTLKNYPKLFTTYIYNRQNLNLRGYYERKFEASFDQKITEDIGITLRGYYSFRDKEVYTISTYPFYPVYNRPNYPKSGGEQLISYIIPSNSSDFSNYTNAGYSKFWGLDLIINTTKIEEINSSFYVAASFGYSEGGRRGGLETYASYTLWKNLDSLKKQYHIGNEDTYIIPVYKSIYDKMSGWNKKLMITYKWDYTIRKLGLWFTLWAQQIVGLWKKSVSYHDDVAIGYITDKNGGTYYEYDKNTPKEAKFYTTYYSEYKNYVVDTWTFNLNISKSLYKGAEVSFFVNNFIDRYNNIFYGLEFSMDINKIFE